MKARERCKCCGAVPRKKGLQFDPKMIGQPVDFRKANSVHHNKAAALAEKVAKGTPFKAKYSTSWPGPRVSIELGLKNRQRLGLFIHNGRAWLRTDSILLASVTLDERYRVHKLRTAAAKYFRKIYSEDLREAEAEVARINAILENVDHCLGD